MDINNLIIFLGCIIIIFLVGKFFVVPLKWIIKIIGNSIIGAIIIFLVNSIGELYGFHIGLNVITTLVVGILGVPGTILLIILKLFL